MNYDVDSYTGKHAKQYYADRQQQYQQYQLEKQARQQSNDAKQPIRKQSVIISLLTSIFSK